MKVAIIKYNAGNVYSVYYALKRLGVEAELTDDKAILSSADKVIFPGVGEAETTMQYLRNHQLDKLIHSRVVFVLKTNFYNYLSIFNLLWTGLRIPGRSGASVQDS